MHQTKSSMILSDVDEDQLDHNNNDKESGNSPIDNESDDSSPSLSSSDIIHHEHDSMQTNSPNIHPIKQRRQSFRSIAIQRSLSQHTQSINNDRSLRLRTVSQNEMCYDDFIVVSTKGADHIKVFCSCCNIYNALYFVSFYHLFMSIPLLCIGFVMFDIDIIINNQIDNNKLLIKNSQEVILFIFYVLFGLLRFVTFSFGIYLIPKFQYENLATLHCHRYNSYKKIVKMWLALLLLSPILYDLLLIIEYLNDLQIENKNINQLDNTAIFIFSLFLSELLFSIYFFFVIHGFVSQKWPNH